MTAQQTQEIVDRYYDAWKTKKGDFGDVPLAERLSYKGPIASFDSAEGFRGMAANAGPLITSFDVRHQLVDGNRVVSIVDMEMSILPSPTTSAELLEIEDGEIVRGEVIYDAQALRDAMAQTAGDHHD